jgi:hypothetical protein
MVDRPVVGETHLRVRALCSAVQSPPGLVEIDGILRIPGSERLCRNKITHPASPLKTERNKKNQYLWRKKNYFQTLSIVHARDSDYISYRNRNHRIRTGHNYYTRVP